MGTYPCSALHQVQLNIPHAPPSQAWLNITEETLNVTIAPTRERLVSGLDLRIGWTWGSARHGDWWDTGIGWPWGLAGQGLAGHGDWLDHISSVIRWALDDRGGCMGCTGNSVEELWMVLWVYASAGMTGLGPKGVNQINHQSLSDEMPV